MSLQMRRIDHDALRFGSFPGKASEQANISKTCGLKFQAS
jgi:hypothetical protein